MKPIDKKELLDLGIEELEPRMEMAVIPTMMLAKEISGTANVLANCGTTNGNCGSANCVPGCGG